MSTQSFPIQRMSTWVTSGSQNPSMNVLPAHSFVLRSYLHITQVFNGGAANNIKCGYDADDDFIFANVGAGSTGFSEPTLGAGKGYNSVARNLEAYFTHTGAAATTGKAFIVIEFMLIQPSP